VKQVDLRTRPVRRLKKLASELPRDLRKEAEAVARKGGTMAKPDLEAAVAEFERKKRYVNYDWT
jgi:hypothetical protein